MDAIEQIVYKVPNVVAKSLPKCQLYHIMVINQTKLNHHLSFKLVLPIGYYQICRNNNSFASFSPSCNWNWPHLVNLIINIFNEFSTTWRITKAPNWPLIESYHGHYFTIILVPSHIKCGCPKLQKANYKYPCIIVCV